MTQTIKDFEQDVSGKDIYLIGGGTSFKPEKYIPLLPKSQVICINSALEDFDNCLAATWFDDTWMKSNIKLLKEKRHKHGIKFTKGEKRLETNKGRDYLSIHNASTKDFSVNKEKYDVCGNNTGSCTIHLLDQLGVNTIYLLGFDCREENGRSHYHNRYNKYVKQQSYNRSFLPNFEQLSKHIKNSTVVNLSENTKIKSFKRARIESILTYK